MSEATALPTFFGSEEAQIMLLPLNLFRSVQVQTRTYVVGTQVVSTQLVSTQVVGTQVVGTQVVGTQVEDTQLVGTYVVGTQVVGTFEANRLLKNQQSQTQLIHL